MTKKYLVVRGRRRWSTTLDGTYTIYSVFESEAIGEALEQEMTNYAKTQFATVDKYQSSDDVVTYYRDLSFLGTPSLAGTVEFVVQRQLGGIWYGFIAEDSISKLFTAAHRAV